MGPSSALLQLGPIGITTTVVTTWAIMLLMTLAAWLVTRRLRVDSPGRLQTAAEGIVLTLQKAVEDVVPEHGTQLLPFVGTLWLLIGVANLAGVVPGVHSPTADLSTTAALALLVFLSVHWFGIRNDGLRAYLRHYVSPNPVLLPFHLISELTRTVALAMRLFGNIMSLELAALLVLLVAGFLVPVPLLMLHIVEALVQAYIFGMLALVYIGGALQAREANVESKQGDNAS
ncbi:MAG TPA: F0F1 ATP synthase subunit A [Burkholderiales bacterium]|nr:F0F1 ATP synthase subunit A [Burkholderiales bacterium]